MTRVSHLLIFLLNIITAILHPDERWSCGYHGRGTCKIIWECPRAQEMLERGVYPRTCGFTRRNVPIVCCFNNRRFNRPPYHDIPPFHDAPPYQDRPPHQDVPPFQDAPPYQDAPPTDNIPSESISQKMCEKYKESSCFPNKKNLHLFVVGGVKSKPKELPFMGLVGYGNDDDISWDCGCSLISEKFVLSAAHCTISPSNGPARWVKLGELDLSTENDTAEPQNFRIKNRINHPNYVPPQVYNDIALYELEDTVKFTSFIKPICLPNPKSYSNVNTVFGAGWGLTDFVGKRSTALLKVDLDLFQLNECDDTASDRRALPRGLDRRSMLCAGSLEGEKDTCLGDSGGPLFLPPENSTSTCSRIGIQLGITSFGRQCALKGFPGVYTNVLYFIPWIESIVWASEGS